MKRVQENDDFNLKNTQCGNSALKKARFDCKSFLESKDSKIRKTTSNKNRKHLHRNASYKMKIDKVDKKYHFQNQNQVFYIHPHSLLNV